MEGSRNGASLCEGFHEGGLEGGLLGTPKDMLSKARKWASTSIGALLLGNMELRFFLRAFLFRGIFMRFSREMQVPCKRVSLSIGTLLGNLEAVCLPGFLTEKKKYIWVPFLDPEDIKILSQGAFWNLVKEQGPPELIPDYGAKRACL